VQELRTLADSGTVQTVSNAVLALTGMAANAEHVQFQVTSGFVRCTTDGVDPDPGKDRGFVLEAPVILVLPRDTAVKLKMIRDGGTDAKVYYESKVY
jgi:hypothetical protein